MVRRRVEVIRGHLKGFQAKVSRPKDFSTNTGSEPGASRCSSLDRTFEGDLWASSSIGQRGAHPIVRYVESPEILERAPSVLPRMDHDDQRNGKE